MEDITIQAEVFGVPVTVILQVGERGYSPLVDIIAPDGEADRLIDGEWYRQSADAFGAGMALAFHELGGWKVAPTVRKDAA